MFIEAMNDQHGGNELKVNALEDELQATASTMAALEALNCDKKHLRSL